MGQSIYSGGIAGMAESIEECYAAGVVKAYIYSQPAAGGIAGDGSVSNSAALNMDIKSVAGNVRVGRIRGRDDTGTLTNNFAFNDMRVIGDSVSDAATDPEDDKNGLGKSAAQLKQQSTYESGLGWDFTNIWEMGPAQYPYPILKWQNGDVLLPEGFTLIID
jgi:hypothetical protein